MSFAATATASTLTGRHYAFVLRWPCMGSLTMASALAGAPPSAPVYFLFFFFALGVRECGYRSAFVESVERNAVVTTATVDGRFIRWAVLCWCAADGPR